MDIHDVEVLYGDPYEIFIVVDFTLTLTIIRGRACRALRSEREMNGRCLGRTTSEDHIRKLRRGGGVGGGGVADVRPGI